jgi:hemolysin D
MPSDDPNKVVPLRAPGLFNPRPLHELEFLPAALEIIETPPSPAGRAVMLTIVALIVFAIGWATIGKVDIIVTSQGRIIPSGKVKEIQPFEIGVVKAIAVHDGQHVAEGDMLIELDATTNAAEREKVARDLMHARLDVARLRSLLDDGHEDRFAALRDADPADVMTALSQMQAQAQEQAAKREAIDHQLAQKRAELDGIKATIDKLTASMPMIQSRVDIRAGGLKTEFGNKIDYLAATQALSEQQHELVVQDLKTTETAQARRCADSACKRMRSSARPRWPT